MLTTEAPSYLPVKQYWSKGELIQIFACPACAGSEATCFADDVLDCMDGTGRETWSTWRCVTCRSLYLNPRPDEGSLPLAYVGYYTHQPVSQMSQGRLSRWLWSCINGYLNTTFGMNESPAWSRVRRLVAFVPPIRNKLDYHGRHLYASVFPKRGNLLDVGCGNGEFLLRAQAMGWHVLGVEPDMAAVNACVSQGLKVSSGFIFDLPAELNGTFDVITLRHAIEHASDPTALVECCHGLLAPGGTIWIAWPNPEGPGLRHYGASWRGLEVPRHLCIPSASAARGILASHGFDDIRFVRRGFHARSIVRESASMSARRRASGMYARSPDAVWVRVCAEFMAALSATGGDELVCIAGKK